MNKRFFNIKGVSEYTSLSKSTVYKRVMNNTIPYLKLGKRVLFDREQIDEWVLNGGVMADDIPEFKDLIN